MKYIITSSVIFDLISKYLDKMFDKFKLIQDKENNTHFFVDGNKYVAEFVESGRFKILKKKGILYLDKKIWKEIMNVFSMEGSEDLNNIMDKWASEKWGFDITVDITDLSELNLEI